MFFAHVTYYTILHVVKQLSRVMSNQAKACIGAAKHLLRYVAGSTDFSITYKQGDF